MTNFDTISELEILRLASAELLSRVSREADRLQERPDSKIAIHHYNRYNTQYEDIKKRIVEIEKAQ